MTMVEPPNAPSPAANTFGISGAHRVPLGAHPIRLHHAGFVEFLAEAALADRGDDRATGNFVLAALDDHRAAAPVLVGLAERSLHARQGELIARGGH